jgi:hypothetical protein
MLQVVSGPRFPLPSTRPNADRAPVVTDIHGRIILASKLPIGENVELHGFLFGGQAGLPQTSDIYDYAESVSRIPPDGGPRYEYRLEMCGRPKVLNE